MKQKFILLDWNIVKALKSPHNDKERDLMFLLQKLQKKYATPFCESHLRDLKKGYSADTKPLVDDDLNFLGTLSRNTALIINESGDITTYSPVDPKSAFAQLLSKSLDNNSPDLSTVNIPPYEFFVDFSALADDHPLKELLGTTNGACTPAIINAFLKEKYDDIFFDKNTYKIFRNYTPKVLNDITMNSPEMFDKFSLALPFYEALKLPEDKLVDVWKNVTESWLKQSLGETIPFGTHLTCAYTMLDMHPAFYDDLKKKKNTLDNITRDANMIYYASFAEYLITEDKECYRKAKFIFKAFDIKTKVMKISEFLATFS